jgi:anti-anti-sigma factor
MTLMELKTKKIKNLVIVYLTGKLDIHFSEEIEKELFRLINEESASNLLLNLKNVEYMSSSGIRIFVSTMRTLRESKRKLYLCEMSSAVMKIFEIVELLSMFEIFETEEEALKAL